MTRYQSEVYARTGCVVVQPVDEFNRPRSCDYGQARVPPSVAEVTALFDAWRAGVPRVREYLPAVRNYVVASLWRRAGLRINESVMLDVADWRPDLGGFGKLHVRFGKGSAGRGPKPRLVPGIDGVDRLLGWWLAEIRPRFGDDLTARGAPLFPSERRLPDGRSGRVGVWCLRAALREAVACHLPAWTGRLTPHGLRHFCASSLYERGVDLKVQELLGHEWLVTTTRYVHVRSGHIEQAWVQANTRVADRLGLTGTDPHPGTGTDPHPGTGTDPHPGTHSDPHSGTDPGAAGAGAGAGSGVRAAGRVAPTGTDPGTGTARAPGAGAWGGVGVGE
ncbi:tyrosine-type recombinase/integrase [Streptomyces sp. NPDC006476]|uniref:tyrosine-type recombinase/integrase n=1 Tax=Streptomyces sp. NPDC006476 TaxID=3157175 RepID=UPI0033B82B75